MGLVPTPDKPLCPEGPMSLGVFLGPTNTAREKLKRKREELVGDEFMDVSSNSIQTDKGVFTKTPFTQQPCMDGTVAGARDGVHAATCFPGSIAKTS